MKTETCKALDMLERAEVLDVNGYLLHNWNMDTLDCEDDESVVEFSYTNEEGEIFEFSFLKKDLVEASVVGHTISMVDSGGEMVDVSCYKLTKLN